MLFKLSSLAHTSDRQITSARSETCAYLVGMNVILWAQKDQPNLGGFAS